MSEAIRSNNTPAAIPPYSQSLSNETLASLYGQIPLDPRTGNIVEGDVTAQAHQVLRNLGEVLAAANLSYANVVKTTVLLSDIADFAAVNAVYGEYFVTDPLPARAAFAVAALPKGALVEIEAIAAY